MQKEIPEQFKEFVKSQQLSDSIQKIGKLFNLHIDQIGELGAEIRDILLGISKSSDFTKHVAERLEISRGDAEKIMEEVNKEVFQTLRMTLQSQVETVESQQPKDQPPIGASDRKFGSEQRFGGTTGSANGGVLRDMPVNAPVKASANASLERAGNFSIEPEMPVAPMAGAAATGATTARNMSGIGKWGMVAPEATAADHAETLHAIENPTLNMERGAKEQFARQKAAEKADEEHYEPLVDQLLNSPAAIPLEKITVKVPMDIPAAAKKEPVKPSAPKPPVNLPTGDPYREAVK